VRLAEAPSHGKPINLYDRESRGAIAYLGLAGEMLRRERKQEVAAQAASKPPASIPAPINTTRN
ncbi:MAG: ParA family protein, partial [Dokdonella sp.]